MTLDLGGAVALRTRVDGGPVFRRDSRVEDAVQIHGHGGELYREEIVELAEAVGLTVVHDRSGEPSQDIKTVAEHIVESHREIDDRLTDLEERMDRAERDIDIIDGGA